MAFRKIALATAAAALAAAPAVAEASLNRAVAPVQGEELGGENNDGAGIFLAIAAAIAIIAGIVIAAGGSDDEGVSP